MDCNQNPVEIRRYQAATLAIVIAVEFQPDCRWDFGCDPSGGGRRPGGWLAGEQVFHLTLMMSLKEAFMNYGEVVDGKVEGLEGFGFVIFISSEEASAIINGMAGKGIARYTFEQDAHIKQALGVGECAAGVGRQVMRVCAELAMLRSLWLPLPLESCSYTQ
ncbi:hypothetical protein ZIOFF_036835 [Zingiber officinale]|uniref:RRM domain-containing protein n=1 Tax=Zingiber officinale TaxID=94328 RepID=A0A8J5GCG6_ZINOF|nr:hypothetical protein ZIOFF_036835 [Zingiber officinale]